MTFINTALEEIFDANQEELRYNALSHRASKLEEKDFSDFMKEGEPKSGKQPVLEVDHEAQMKQFKKG